MDLRPNLVSFGGEKPWRRRRRREGEEEEEGKEKKKKKKEAGRRKEEKKGMESNIKYGILKFV